MGGEATRSVIEHSQSEQQRLDRQRREREIKETIDKCSRAISRGTDRHWYYVSRKLTSLIKLLKEHDSVGNFYDYDQSLRGETDWYLTELQAYIRDTGDYVKALRPDQSQSQGVVESLQDIVNVGIDRQAGNKRVVERAFRSVVLIAQEENIVDTELKNFSEATGHAIPLGRHWQQFDMNFGDPVKVISDDSGLTKTLFCGGTGQGKSASAESEVEDRYNHGRKIIDILDFHEGENINYDIPQNQDDLRSIRESMDLPPDFTESDEYKDIDLEIMVPLTPDLEEKELPYHEEEGFQIRPFTIPISEFGEQLLIAILNAMLSGSEESTLRAVHSEVDSNNDVWGINELADGIRRSDELSSSKKESIISTLNMLRNERFIKTEDDPHAIDWKRIFHTPGTVTAFTQSKMDSEIGKLMCVAYLIHSIDEIRTDMRGLDAATLVMRELHEISPHQQESLVDKRAKSLQRLIGNILAKLMRQNRHRRVELIADTQDLGHILKGVRKDFNRFVTFNLNKSSMGDIFDYTNNSKFSACMNTISIEKGVAAVIGQVEPATRSKDIEFVSPVQYVPASFHHFDTEEESSGWHNRQSYLDDVELRKPAEMGVDWGGEDEDEQSEIPVEKKDEDESFDPNMYPTKAFVQECVKFVDDRDVNTNSEFFWQTFEEFIDDVDGSSLTNKNVFGMKIKTAMEEIHDHELENQPRPDPRPNDNHKSRAYLCVSFTDKGQMYSERTEFHEKVHGDDGDEDSDEE